MEQSKKCETISGIPLKLTYTPEDMKDMDYRRDLGNPGEFPFTRGIHAEMYRGQLWTRRSQIGFSTPQLTHERIMKLYEEGQTGFTMTVDLPTSYGFDSDEPIAEGEVGVTGVPLSTWEDLDVILGELSPENTTISLSVRPPVSAVSLAMYIICAEKRGVDLKKVMGTIQDDPVFQMAGGPIQTITDYFPLDGIYRLAVDVVEYCVRNMPRVNYMLANGYNLRETGLSAIQEAGFALGSTIDIMKMALARGLRIDDVARRVSFFHSAHRDFFEEIAKYRAMRRLWAKLMKGLGAREPRSMWFRTSTQTAGSSLTSQQPLNNIIRATIESMAAILGGTQSLQAASYDEGLALPTEESATMSLRIQQIIAHESGVTNVIDPLGGSYLVEFLTDEMERKIKDLIGEIEYMGGMKVAIEKGWVENEIEKAMTSEQRKVENKERILVGVNEFRAKEEPPIRIHIPETKRWEEERRTYLSDYRKNRGKKKVREALDRVKEAWGSAENMIPILVDALKASATHGEIQDAMREAQGFKTEWW
jgi:methylmalonyl-CoA mutase N-terminal domain/subunit